MPKEGDKSPAEGEQEEVALWEGVGQCSWVLSRKLEMLKVCITCGKVGQLMENKKID